VIVGDVRCTAPRSPVGPEEHASLPELVVPRSGVFLVCREHREVVADPNTAVVLREGDSYRVSHPTSGGDHCTVFVLRRPDFAEELLLRSAPAGVIPIQLRLAVHRLAARLGLGIVDEFEADEEIGDLLQALAGKLALSSSRTPLSGSSLSRRVVEVQTLLASAPGSRWSLDSLGRTLHCSPYHLVRQFRAATGQGIAGYLTGLRLGIALDRLAEGETDLAILAHELGFSSHSHFTARFHSILGITPSRLRNQLGRHRLGELRTDLTARAQRRR
jgi:AraC family transcriptional regulator